MYSADADYCIDWMGREDLLDARLLLVKRNHVLKPMLLNTQEPLECVKEYSSSTNARFVFINEAGEKIFVIESLGGGVIMGGSSSAIRIDGPKSGIEIRDLPILIEVPEREISVDFPDEASYFETLLKSYEEYKKEDLLQFKGKIVDAYVKREIFCPPNLDTIYYVNFRAGITGECDSANVASFREDSLSRWGF
jgi:hypothetical protein